MEQEWMVDWVSGFCYCKYGEEQAGESTGQDRKGKRRPGKDGGIAVSVSRQDRQGF